MENDAVTRLQFPGKDPVVITMPVNIRNGFKPLNPFGIVFMIYKQSRIVQDPCSMGPCNKLRAGLYGHRIQGQPDGAQLLAVNAIVTGIVMPGRDFLRPGLLDQHVIMVDAYAIGSRQTTGDLRRG